MQSYRFSFLPLPNTLIAFGGVCFYKCTHIYKYLFPQKCASFAQREGVVLHPSTPFWLRFLHLCNGLFTLLTNQGGVAQPSIVHLTPQPTLRLVFLVVERVCTMGYFARGGFLMVRNCPKSGVCCGGGGFVRLNPIGLLTIVVRYLKSKGGGFHHLPLQMHPNWYCSPQPPVQK